MANVVDDLPKAESRKVEAAPTVAAPRKSPVKYIVLGMVAIGAAVGAWAWFHFRDQVSSDDAQVDAHIVAIAPKISGNVTEVLVRDNQQVKAGEVLVRIDPRDYQARVNAARAALLQAESQVVTSRTMVPMTNESTQSGVSGAAAQVSDAMAELDRARLNYEQAASSDIAEAEAKVRSKQASNDRAQADLARMKPLLDKAEISRLQYDAYQAQARVAESELNAAQEQLKSAQNNANMRKAAVAAAQSRVNMAQSQVQASMANRKQVDVRRAETGTASAGVEAARANLAAAELMLSYTTIVAPSDGVVTRKSVEPGQIVQPGQSLMTLIQLQDVWVTANFKETQLAQVRAGQKAEIHVDMYGKSVAGHVDSIAGATGSRLSLLPAENATGNFVKVVQRIPVKILVDNTNGLVLRPGMNVDATIFVN
uniref:Secretion protein HlyD family protein n=1 Tax=Solibacter usitatus (strain Ellin6076) TaxID=234267 RepID=Q01NG8_SOLUE